MGTQLKILALGDVVGESGRRLVEEFIPSLRRELSLIHISEPTRPY